MPVDEEASERTHLLDPQIPLLTGQKTRSSSSTRSHGHSEVIGSISSSHVSSKEHRQRGAATGERLPYNDYTTIDWLHDLSKDSLRYRALHSRKGVRAHFWQVWDSCQGWIAAVAIGLFTAVVAYLVDVVEAVLSDYKMGYCSRNIFRMREACCNSRDPLPDMFREPEENCTAWKSWSKVYTESFVIYIAIALLFGLVAGGVTTTTKANLPVPKQDDSYDDDEPAGDNQGNPQGKSMYMAAGSGIPEIKTILSGFVIPHFLDFKVLVVKAIGAAFAVATGMCLGKEGPFVHISTCCGYLVACWFPKYRENGRKMREMLSVACSAGLSVAFGAPIGGVLFSYEEISTYFPRKVLWRAFLCSLTAAIVLKELNPAGTGKLILFETNYGIDYKPIHYFVFALLGGAGGLFGGVFCKASFIWSKSFRRFVIIRNHPVLELCLVIWVTAVLQYPNPLVRAPGDIIIRNLLVDCRQPKGSWVCEQESLQHKRIYYAWLIYGTLVKLGLTIITFGCKVPSGIIIPALDAGALCGRLVGQAIGDISPGIFAMVGAAAFLAGVSRMTVSLTVIMFELTGEVNYIPPFMIAILIAKWVADGLSREGVYDLAQTVLGHPFLDADHALNIVQGKGSLVEELIPPSQTMREITVNIGSEHKVSKQLLAVKLTQLKARGLMDAGLVLVDTTGRLHGYLAQGELDFAIHEEGLLDDEAPVDLLEGVLSGLVDRTPLAIPAKAPMEYAIEMFGKLGLRYLIVTEEETSRVVGVIIKKRLVSYLDSRHH